MLGLSPLLAGMYGILHDQITYTISHEYYTKFKFIQFGLLPKDHVAIFANPRIQVSIVGFLATWWVGLIIGVVLCTSSLIFRKIDNMIRAVLRAFILNIFIALVVGLIGLLYGKYILTHQTLNWWMPDNLIDRDSFIMVGAMHNFSYLGGLLGLVLGVILEFKNKRKWETSNVRN